MTIPKDKNSIEKFIDTLNTDEKELLSTYVKEETYESLSDKFDDLLKQHASQKANNQRV